MEADFRKRVQQLFDRIETTFEGVDPDVAECEQSQGSLVITLSDRSKCILSVQPSVRQIWLAIASRGTAYHFDYRNSETSGAAGQWLDDKGRGIELTRFLRDYLKEATGIEFKF